MDTNQVNESVSAKQGNITRRGFIAATSAFAATLGATGLVGNNLSTDAFAADTSTSSEEEIACTSCRACIHNCAVLAHVRDGRIIRLEGDECDPMSRGHMCPKGMAGVQALYNPNRMKYPMRRTGPRGTNRWERISWDEACNQIADAIWELDQKGDSMQLLTTTGGGGNPQFYSAIRFAGLNISNFFEPGCAQCFLPRQHGMPVINGITHNSIADSGASEIYFDDNESKALILWGTGPSQSCPGGGGRGLAECRARGTKTVVVDPRFTPDASKADVWLSIRPGTDVALEMAWIRYILEGKHYNEEFCMKWTNLPYLVNEETKLTYKASELGIGSEEEYVVWDKKTNSPKPMPFPWDDNLDPELDGEFDLPNGKKSRTAFRALKERCDEFTLEKAAEICWLEADKIEEAIKIFIEASPHAGICLGVATDQYEQSAQAAMAITILDVIMGNINTPGALTQARAEVAPGTYLLVNFGLMGPHPLQMPKDAIARRYGFLEHKGLGAWHASHIPTLREALRTGKPYKPRIWMDRSGNKPVVLGGAEQFMHAAKAFELTVHMYMYPTTMSVDQADIILPTAEWLETAYAAERMNLLTIRQDLTHLYEAVDETMAWTWIAKCMAERGHERFKQAFDWDFAGDYPVGAYFESYDQYKDWVAQYMANAFKDGRKWTWDDFKKAAPIEYMTMEDYKNQSYGAHEAIDPDTGKPAGVSTASGKCEPYSDGFVVLGRTGSATGVDAMGYTFPPASYDYDPLPYFREPDESPLTDEEYPYVLTEGRIPFFHHGTLRNVPYIREIYPTAQCWIHPQTADEIGVKTGDWVKMESRRGETHGHVLVTEGILPGVVYQERFWNPELLDSENPKDAWTAMNINVLTRGDGPVNDVYGTYTLRGFTIKVTKSEKPEGIWMEPEDFEPWLPEVSDDMGGGYVAHES